MLDNITEYNYNYNCQKEITNTQALVDIHKAERILQ